MVCLSYNWLGDEVLDGGMGQLPVGGRVAKLKVKEYLLSRQRHCVVTC